MATVRGARELQVHISCALSSDVIACFVTQAELAKLEATSRAMLVLREYELQLEFQKSRNEPAPSGWSQGSGSSLRAANPAAAPPRCLVAQADPLSTGLPNDEAYIA
eukprot:2633381-Pleurochrysis_carterae.AAC.9